MKYYGVYYSSDDELIETIWTESAQEAFDIFAASNTAITEPWYVEECDEPRAMV